MAPGLKTGQLRLSLRSMTSLEDASHDVEPDQEETDPATGATPDVHSLDFVLSDLTLALAYAVSDRWAFELMQPLRLVHVDAVFSEDGSEVADFESIHHRDETLFGPGDSQLWARYAALQPALGSPHKLDLRLGFTVPLGSTEENPFARGRRGLEHQHVQFGNGTVDPLLGVESTHGFGSFSLYNWATAQFSLYENTHGFQAGPRVSGGALLAVQLGESEFRLGLGPEIYHEQPSTWESGEEAVNSGRTDIVATGAAMWFPSDDWLVELQVKKPFTVHAEGGQLELPFAVALGLTTTFDVADPGHDHADDHQDHGGHDHAAQDNGEHDHAEHAGAEGQVPSGADEPDVLDVATEGESFKLQSALVPGKVTVIDFWATWCGPCHEIDRVLRSLATQYPKLAVRRAQVIDVDSPVAVEHLSGSKALPVIWVFDAQGKRVDVMEATTAPQVRQRVLEQLGAHPAH